MTVYDTSPGWQVDPPCQYGESRLTFRGPPRDVTGKYIVALGGSLTYGRQVLRPFPQLIEEQAGMPVVNLACHNAGPDVWTEDPVTADLLAGAKMGLVQLTGAVNQSNPYYSVHPRRNDRFLSATPLLRAIYRDVDFAEINFTRHLMRSLWARGADRFAPVANVLRELWLMRMRRLLAQMTGPVVLIWVAPHRPGAASDDPTGALPLISRDMLEALRPLVAAVVEHVGPCDWHERRTGADAADLGLHHNLAQRITPEVQKLIS